MLRDLHAMKRVLIVGWFGCAYPRYNFGTALQSYALQKKCRDIGFDARLLTLELHRTDSHSRRVLKKSGVWRIIEYAYDVLKTGRLWPCENACRLRRWAKRHYVVNRIASAAKLSRMLKDSCCVISGSDQIWNANHLFSPVMFLAFEADYGVDVPVRRISYASSIGTNDIPIEYKDAMCKYLRRFSAISVRESSAISVLSTLTGRTDLVRVCDPSFLLSDDEWISIANEEPLRRKVPKKYLLCYLLSKNTSYGDRIKIIAEHYGIENVVVVPSYENPDFQYPNYGDGGRYEFATPSEFLQLMLNASLIVTDSFHGMALSINLSRQFIAFMRFNDADVLSQNSRVYDLLKRYGLMWRLYENHDFAKRRQIEYGAIRMQVSAERVQSLEWLVQNIG